MPSRRVRVPASAESHVFNDFANLSLADTVAPGRTYPPGDHYSSSEPRYDPRSSRSSRYARDPPPGYHGPHFEKALAQEKLWDARGARDVWDPTKPLPSVTTRPETRGRAHSIHQPRQEHAFSDPYVARPDPFTNRVRADYKAYKDTSEAHGAISREVGAHKNVRVGRNHYPEFSDRERIREGKKIARTGRDMANIAGQARAGYDQKYPQVYKNLTAVSTHAGEARKQKACAAAFRESDKELDQKLRGWETQMGKQRGIYDL